MLLPYSSWALLGLGLAKVTFAQTFDCPPGCDASCSDSNGQCGQPYACGGWWDDQCKKSCGKCSPCTSVCPTEKPKTRRRRGPTERPPPQCPPGEECYWCPDDTPGPPCDNEQQYPERRRRDQSGKDADPPATYAPSPGGGRRRKSKSRRRRKSGGGKGGGGSRRRKSSSRRRKSSSRRRKDEKEEPEKSRRRKKGGGGGGGGGKSEPPKNPRYQCTAAMKWKSDVTKWAGNTNFCKCGYSGECPEFGICGGGKPNAGGQCGPAACSEGIYTFDKDNTWIITVKKEESKANPYRAFAYLFFKPTSEVTFSFTFKSISHNTVYSKLFFWGDGNNILGLLPPASAGGESQFCLKPSADDPPPSCGAKYPVKDDTWYRVDLLLTPPNTIALSVNGKSVGSMSIQSSMNQVNPMLGVYHWARGDPGTYKLLYRDMCVGESKLQK